MTIAVDTGHGYNGDTGAIGVKGLRESDVVAAVGAVVQKLLASVGHLVIDVPRTSLAGRVWFVKRCYPPIDVLLSLHANWAQAQEAGGFEVWTSCGTTAADRLGELLCETMALVEPTMRQRGEKDADYAILTKTSMPAVLLEIGFISNPVEALRVVQPEYHWRLAAAILWALMLWERERGL